jgi:hypothetical protein
MISRMMLQVAESLDQYTTMGGHKSLKSSPEPRLKTSWFGLKLHRRQVYKEQSSCGNAAGAYLSQCCHNQEA